MSWWIVDSGPYIRVGGLVATGWIGITAFSGSTVVPGRTVLNDTAAFKMRQDCNLDRVRIRVIAPGIAAGFQAKVFRDVGATYDFVGESQLFTAATQGLQVIDFTTPVPVLQGDSLGLFVQGHATVAASRSSVGSTGTGIREDGNIAASGNDFGTSEAGTAPQLEALSFAPHAAFVGDSWVSGHAVPYLGQLASPAFTGTRTSEVPYRMSTLEYMPAGWEFQSFGFSGSTLDGTISGGNLALAVASRAHAIVVMAGGNDVFAGQTADDIEADLDLIPALLLPHQHLFVSEIGPGTRYNDAASAVLRAVNTRIATWCAANGATMLSMHDQLAQTRVSTGQLDDMLAAYDHDGAHLSQAGVDKLAELWADGITTYYTANPTLVADPAATNSMVPVLLGTASSLVSATTMASGTISPSANSLLVVAVGHGTNTGTITPASMADAFSGGSLTWTKLQDMQGTGTGIFGAALFWAKAGATPGSGVITATWNVVGTRKTMVVMEIATGYDTVAPIVQSVEAADNNIACTVTLAGTPETDSLVIGLCHSLGDANSDIYPASVFAQVGEIATVAGSNDPTLMMVFANLNVPAAVKFDGANNINNVLMAVEIAAAASGAQTVNVNAIASTAIVYQPTLTVGAVTVTPNVIASTETVFQPTITTGAVTVSPDAIASTAQIFAPTLTFGAVTIALDTMVSVAVVYAPTVQPGAVTVALDLIASTAIVYQPTVQMASLQTITPDFIESTSVVYQVIVALLTLSAERTFAVEFEDRRFNVELEDRRFNVELEIRTYTVS